MSQEYKPLVFAFGRMNPPTAGHSKLIDHVHQTAKDMGADHKIVVSHSQDKHKNPVSQEHKMDYLKSVHPKSNFHASDSKSPTFMHHLKQAHKDGHTHVTMVAGSDRVEQFQNLVNKYNGPKGEFNFKEIKVVSAGHRDPDAEGTSGISGTKMRAHAASGDYASFKQGLHGSASHKHARRLYTATRQGMELQREEKVLDFKSFLTEEEKKSRGASGDGHFRSTESGAGMTAKGVAAYRRKNPGSKLSTAVTTPPSKLKKGSKAANRRKSFCARMSGNKGPMKDEKGRPTRKAMALRRWNC